MSSHAALRPVTTLHLSYIVTTNFSRIFKTWSSTVDLNLLSFANARGASGHTSHVCHESSSLASKDRHYVTTSEGMEGEKLFSLLRTYWRVDVVHRNPPQGMTLAKGNQSTAVAGQSPEGMA